MHHIASFAIALALIALNLSATRAQAGDQPIGVISTSGSVYKLDFSPNGRWLAAWVGESSSTIEVFSVADRKSVAKFEGRRPAFAFSPDSKWLALSVSRENSAVELISTETWRAGPQFAAEPDERDGEIVRLAFGADGKQLAVAAASGNIRLLDVAAKKSLRSWSVPEAREPLKRINFLGFSPKGNIVIAFGYRDVIVREFADPPVEMGPLDIGIYMVQRTALSPDGQIFVTDGKDDPRLFDRTAGKLKFSLKGVSGHMQDMAFTPSGRHLLTACLDCRGNKDGTPPASVQVRLWDVSTGQLTSGLSGKLPSVFSVAIAPDESIFATGGDKEIAIWDFKKMVKGTKAAPGSTVRPK